MSQLSKSSDKLPVILMVAYCAASFLRTAYPIARGVMLGSSILIAAYASIKQRGKLKISIGPFHFFPLLFLLYCYFTALWAEDRTLTFAISNVISQIMITLYLAYLYFQEVSSDQLLWIIMMSGYVVCLFAMRDQGLNTYIRAIFFGMRVYDHDYINANTMGMLMSSSLVINVYIILYKKKLKWWTILMVPAAICMFGAGSKKGFLLLGMGLGMLLLLRNINSREKLFSMFKIAVFGAAFIAIVLILIRLPIFSFIMERFEGMFNFLKGSGKVDYSTQDRVNMMEAGMKVFKKSPIFGVGINNPRLHNFHSAYLHNNYLELLAGGGIIGWLLYYAMYAYILWNFWKYRAYRTGEYDCCLTLLILHITLEFAYVAYFNKETWFYFMLGFAEVRRLKLAAKQGKRAMGGL